jgi:hypothetical protein
MCGIPDWLKTAGKVAFPVPFALHETLFNAGKNLLSPPGAPDMGAAPPPPPPPADLTDEEVQRARSAMIRRQLLGQGTASSFLTGPLGDLTTAPILKPSAGGM